MDLPKKNVFERFESSFIFSSNGLLLEHKEYLKEMATMKLDEKNKKIVCEIMYVLSNACTKKTMEELMDSEALLPIFKKAIFFIQLTRIPYLSAFKQLSEMIGTKTKKLVSCPAFWSFACGVLDLKRGIRSHGTMPKRFYLAILAGMVVHDEFDVQPIVN